LDCNCNLVLASSAHTFFVSICNSASKVAGFLFDSFDLASSIDNTLFSSCDLASSDSLSLNRFSKLRRLTCASANCIRTSTREGSTSRFVSLSSLGPVGVPAIGQHLSLQTAKTTYEEVWKCSSDYPTAQLQDQSTPYFSHPPAIPPYEVKNSTSKQVRKVPTATMSCFSRSTASFLTKALSISDEACCNVSMAWRGIRGTAMTDLGLK